MGATLTWKSMSEKVDSGVYTPGDEYLGLLQIQLKLSL